MSKGGGIGEGTKRGARGLVCLDWLLRKLTGVFEQSARKALLLSCYHVHLSFASGDRLADTLRIIITREKEIQTHQQEEQGAVGDKKKKITAGEQQTKNEGQHSRYHRHHRHPIITNTPITTTNTPHRSCLPPTTPRSPSLSTRRELARRR